MKRTVTLVSAALMTVTAMAGCGKKEGANNTRDKESVAAAAQEDVPKEEVAKLQGTWKVLALESGGSKAPDDYVKQMRFLIEEDRISLSGKPDGLLPYRLDPAATPRAIDIPDSENEKEFSKAIYEVEGDTLKLCFSQATELDRPKDFNTAGTMYLCFTLKREKP